MLVIVEDGDIHALAQLAFHEEALRSLDVFEVDGAEGRLQRCDHIDQLLWVFFVDFDVKHIDAGELLEQYALAFHHGLGGQCANIAQAQHGGAVGDHGHQIAAAGVLEGGGRVLDDFLAGRSYAGRVGQRQVVLVGHGLGGSDGDLAGLGKLVVFERRLAQQSTFVLQGG